MKINNLIMINMFNTLQYYGEKKLPQRISYAITKNLMLLSKEYECYNKELVKTFNKYDEYMIKDKKNNPILNKSGIPLVSDDVYEEYMEEITSLLNIEIDIDIYTIPVDTFDYVDEKDRYDVLSAKDIITLQDLLCEHEEKGSDKDVDKIN